MFFKTFIFVRDQKISSILGTFQTTSKVRLVGEEIGVFLSREAGFVI